MGFWKYSWLWGRPAKQPLHRQVPKRRVNNPLMVEVLEERTLLSVASALSGQLATFTGNAGHDSLYLQVNSSNVLQFSTDGTNYSSNLGSGTSSLTIGSGASIQVNFSGPNSNLYISSSLSSVLQSTGATLSYVASFVGRPASRFKCKPIPTAPTHKRSAYRARRQVRSRTWRTRQPHARLFFRDHAACDFDRCHARPR